MRRHYTFLATAAAASLLAAACQTTPSSAATSSAPQPASTLTYGGEGPAARYTSDEIFAIYREASRYQGPHVDAPRGLDGKPDFTGHWAGIRQPGRPGGNLGKDEPNFHLPYTEAGERAHVYSQNHTVDPEAVCILGGIPRHNGSGLPFEILHTPDRLATMYNYNTHRWVTINPELRHDDSVKLDQRYFGHGYGRWEGDTLIIETRGLYDSSFGRIWLDENGDPTSDETIVEERWTRPDYHHLQLVMTVTDLKYYERPFTFTRTWVRSDPGVGANEYACNESNQVRFHMGPGAGIVGPDGNRGFGYNAPLPSAPPGPEAYSNIIRD